MMTPFYHSCHTSPITSMLVLSTTDTDTDTDINDHTVVTASAKELIIWELNTIEPGINAKTSREHQGAINVSGGTSQL